jgi:hypothetical protein
MTFDGKEKRQYMSMHPEVIDRLARIETHIETMLTHVEKQNGRVSKLESRAWTERAVVGVVASIAAVAGFLNGGNH